MLIFWDQGDGLLEILIPLSLPWEAVTGTFWGVDRSCLLVQLLLSGDTSCSPKTTVSEAWRQSLSYSPRQFHSNGNANNSQNSGRWLGALIGDLIWGRMTDTAYKHSCVTSKVVGQQNSRRRMDFRTYDPHSFHPQSAHSKGNWGRGSLNLGLEQPRCRKIQILWTPRLRSNPYF